MDAILLSLAAENIKYASQAQPSHTQPSKPANTGKKRQRTSSNTPEALETVLWITPGKHRALEELPDETKTTLISKFNSSSQSKKRITRYARMTRNLASCTNKGYCIAQYTSHIKRRDGTYDGRRERGSVCAPPPHMAAPPPP